LIFGSEDESEEDEDEEEEEEELLLLKPTLKNKLNKHKTTAHKNSFMDLFIDDLLIKHLE
jgi:hypothetical protein